MDESETVLDWRGALQETWQGVVDQLITFVPQLLMAVLILVIGWVIARILGATARRGLLLFDRLFQRLPATRAWYPEGLVRNEHARLVGKLVFWMVMLFFIAFSTTALGWQMFAAWMADLLANLPNVITGVLIIFAGYLLANVVEVAARTAAASANFSRPAIPARIARLLTLLTALVIGIEQAGINVGFLTNLMLVVLTTTLAGAALAFGLGARGLVACIIGMQQLRRHVALGERIRVGEIEGVLIELTQTSMILETGHGREIVPAWQFLRRNFGVVSGEDSGGVNDESAA